jgi:hypothetical protein
MVHRRPVVGGIPSTQGHAANAITSRLAPTPTPNGTGSLLPTSAQPAWELTSEPPQAQP